MMVDYGTMLSKRAAGLKPSAIRRFFDMLAGKPDVISLTIGQPDFVTPWHIRAAGIESLRDGKTYYTSNSGIQPLREEISAYLRRRFGLGYDPGEIVVTVGGSEAIDISMRALVDMGDEVIIPEPSFVCYEPLAVMAGGVPVTVNTLEKDGFRLTPEQVEKAMSGKTKALVLPFPANPTGAVMSKRDLEGIACVLRGTNVAVISDEIYAELTYGERHCSIASLDGMRERTIIVNGFSKSYAMTGWRLGYTAAPAPITKQLVKMHQFSTMCAPTTSQFAAVEALKNGDEDIEMMKAEYNDRRRYLLNRLNGCGIPCFEPNGAFYVFANISGFGLTSDEFCERLVNEGRVALVPGTAFGSCGEGFVRISYAYALDHIRQACDRISEFTKKLTR